jgi:hypothetical protein|tara:strand:- start:69 stop:674 length:606 start_codon:yes stop_codon:yes gene_type:complete
VGKFTDTDLFDFETDYEAYFDRAFNKLINKVLDDLATPENSPVYTGYFASSWKAQAGGGVGKETQEESDRNRRERRPWNEVYHKPTPGKGGIETPWGIKKNMGVIERRFNKNGFYANFKKYNTVYIGNTAHYAAYALEDGLTVAYIQDLKRVVDIAFKENPALASIKAGVVPKARVAGAIPETKAGTPMLEPPTSVLTKDP